MDIVINMYTIRVQASEKKDYDAAVAKAHPAQEEGAGTVDLQMRVRFVDGDKVIADTASTGMLRHQDEQYSYTCMYMYICMYTCSYTYIYGYHQHRLRYVVMSSLSMYSREYIYAHVHM